jgi:hypothetical protein
MPVSGNQHRSVMTNKELVDLIFLRCRAFFRSAVAERRLSRTCRELYAVALRAIQRVLATHPFSSPLGNECAPQSGVNAVLFAYRISVSRRDVIATGGGLCVG